MGTALMASLLSSTRGFGSCEGKLRLEVIAINPRRITSVAHLAHTLESSTYSASKSFQ